MHSNRHSQVAGGGARARQRRRGPWWTEWDEDWGGRGGGGPRMRRGDIRFALLEALGDGPAHGYELINRLEERSGGAWRPSPGSVYPTLQLLEDEGLVRSEERDTKRVYEVTASGRAVAAERAAHADDEGAGHAGHGRSRGPRGWRSVGEKLGPALAPLVMAIRQVAMTGDEGQIERGEEILRRATKELYQVLVGD